MRSRNGALAAYTFAHFSVDFCCFVLLFGGFRSGINGSASTGFLLYNVIAFGLQTPIGDYCDRHPRFPAGLLGCTLVFAGPLLMAYPWPSLVIAALGNACFHVEGGIDSLANARGRISRSGVFVSSGALGVALGTFAGKAGVGLWLPAGLLLLSMAGIALLNIPIATEHSRFIRGQGVVTAFPAAMVMLFVAVTIRSYGGFIVQLPWKADYFFMLPSMAACLGKALGGILADRFGARQVGVLSLLAAIPLLCLWQSPLPGLLGLLLFNMNMPITLCAISDRLPGHPGLAFGITTLALLCGSLPVFFYALPEGYLPYILTILCALSAGMIFLTVPGKEVAKDVKTKGNPI